ncbi:unnamed protein product [Urochloa humidicola]
MEKGSPTNHAAADLPDDLIVEILARLPAGSLCRCKCVFRSWRSLISDPAHRARLEQTLSGCFVFSRPAAAPSSWSFVATRQSLPLQGEGEGGAPLVDTALSFIPPSHAWRDRDSRLMQRPRTPALLRRSASFLRRVQPYHRGVGDLAPTKPCSWPES